jgi:hypothetical protein
MYTIFWLENLKGRDHLEDNNRMDCREIGLGGVDGMHLAPDRDQWQTLVNMVMNLWVP